MADGVGFQNEVIGRERHTGRLDIIGSGNRVEFEEDCGVGANILIRGDGNHLRIGRGSMVTGYICIETSGALFDMGEYVSVNDSSFHMHEPSRILIGNNAAFAQHVWVTTTDMHPIYDRTTGERVNPAADVIVGARAWVAFRSVVLKGSRIGEGAVIGATSTVCGEIPDHALAMGVPARVSRDNIEWDWNVSDRDATREVGMLSQSGVQI